MEERELNNGVKIPSIGFGTWQIEDLNQAKQCVKDAISLGYRHIDTAMIYGNEEAVGKGIQESLVPREELFITTKLWNDFRGYDETIKACEASLERLGLEYIDLYLIHWPVPKKYKEDYQKLNTESYQAMEELYRRGKIRALGVSNFLPHHIEELKANIEVPITVNQIEFHPYYDDVETREYCQKNHILLEAYSPLGRGQVLKDETILRIAKQHHKTAAQICIRYALENQLIPLPKTIDQSRMKENLDVFDFQLTLEEIEDIKKLSHKDGKIGSDPNLGLL